MIACKILWQFSNTIVIFQMVYDLGYYDVVNVVKIHIHYHLLNAVGPLHSTARYQVFTCFCNVFKIRR